MTSAADPGFILLRDALIALTLQTCPHIPDPLPTVYIKEDKLYEQTIPAKFKHSWGLYKKWKWRGFTFEYIVLRLSTANERTLCHEWGHAIYGPGHDWVEDFYLDHPLTIKFGR